MVDTHEQNEALIVLGFAVIALVFWGAASLVLWIIGGAMLWSARRAQP